MRISRGAGWEVFAQNGGVIESGVLSKGMKAGRGVRW